MACGGTTTVFGIDVVSQWVLELLVILTLKTSVVACLTQYEPGAGHVLQLYFYENTNVNSRGEACCCWLRVTAVAGAAKCVPDCKEEVRDENEALPPRRVVVPNSTGGGLGGSATPITFRG